VLYQTTISHGPSVTLNIISDTQTLSKLNVLETVEINDVFYSLHGTLVWTISSAKFHVDFLCGLFIT